MVYICYEDNFYTLCLNYHYHSLYRNSLFSGLRRGWITTHCKNKTKNIPFRDQPRETCLPCVQGWFKILSTFFWNFRIRRNSLYSSRRWKGGRGGRKEEGYRRKGEGRKGEGRKGKGRKRNDRKGNGRKGNGRKERKGEGRKENRRKGEGGREGRKGNGRKGEGRRGREGRGMGGRGKGGRVREGRGMG
jgi:hypothetical protein